MLKKFNSNSLVMTDFNSNNTDIYINSDMIADRINVTHHGINQRIEKYYDELSKYSKLIPSFEKQELHSKGQPRKYYLLTYEQTTFLLSLFRNTKEIVDLKNAINHQFFIKMNELNRASITHDLSKPVSKTLHQAIQDNLDNTDYAYSNFNKLIYKYAFGIPTTQIKRIRKIPKKANIMDYLSEFELKVVDKAKQQIISLIELKHKYSKVRDELQGKCLLTSIDSQYKLA